MTERTFRYEGNDSNQVSSAGGAGNAADATTSAGASQTVDHEKDTSYEAPQETTTSHNTYGGHEAGGIQSYHSIDESSHDGHAFTGNGVQSAEGESHGTGIKEDG